MAPEHRILCRLAREEGSASGDWILIEIDGITQMVRLRIGELARRLVENLDPVILDLLEIAACVYAADSAITRGGPADAGLGKNWRRRLSFTIPVRRPDLWGSQEVADALAETLGFLSDDFYSFRFEENPQPREPDRYLSFGRDGSLTADEVLLFSGGLDSLAGALDEMISRGKSVALVSHHSSGKLAKVQTDLVKELRMRAGAGRVLHVPVTVQLKKRSNREPTHRSRSFLFAALGVATARIFGRDRLRFYENGIVSLNLPPSGQVVGARATRSTHPQALAGFGRLFGALFGRPVRVENPFAWKTKKEIVEVIAQHGAAELISAAHSCAHVHERSVMTPHCGRCSQCIDRRFAVLAAGLEEHDPEDSYAVDLLHGARKDGPDREMALGYVRHARRLATTSPLEFLTSFGEVSRALRFFDEPAGAVAARLHALHRRHGEGVAQIMERALRAAVDRRDVETLAPDCLLRLTGRDVFGLPAPGAEAAVAASPASLPAKEETDRANQDTNELVELRIGGAHVAEIAGLGTFKGATAEILATLAPMHLKAAGEGLEPEDYPVLTPEALAERWCVDGGEPVRRRISRARRALDELRRKGGQSALDPAAIIENVPRKGYRLNPFRVRVVRIG